MIGDDGSKRPIPNTFMNELQLQLQRHFDQTRSLMYKANALLITTGIYFGVFLGINTNFITPKSILDLLSNLNDSNYTTLLLVGISFITFVLILLSATIILLGIFRTYCPTYPIIISEYIKEKGNMNITQLKKDYSIDTLDSKVIGSYMRAMQDTEARNIKIGKRLNIVLTLFIFELISAAIHLGLLLSLN